MSERTSSAHGRGAFAELQDALGELVQELTGLARGLGSDRPFPRTELRVEDDAFRVLAELPGVARDDIDVTVAGRTLTIAGARPAPELPEGARLVRRERPSGRFERELELPGDVDVLAVVADFTAGVLDIRLPKRSPERRRVRIEAGPEPTDRSGEGPDAG